MVVKTAKKGANGSGTKKVDPKRKDAEKMAANTEAAVKEAETVMKELSQETTVAERFEKMELLAALRDRHGRIKGKFQDLRKLKAANDGTTTLITVRAADDVAISLSDTDLINEVINMLDGRLCVKLEETEREVLELTV